MAGFTTTIVHADRQSPIEHGSLHKPIHANVAYGYEDARDLDSFLAHFLRNPPLAYRRDVVEAASRCDWARLAGRMDDIVEGLAASAKPSPRRHGDTEKTG